MIPIISDFFGIPGRNRTAGLSLRRRTLYPTELRRRICRKKAALYFISKQFLPFRMSVHQEEFPHSVHDR